MVHFGPFEERLGIMAEGPADNLLGVPVGPDNKSALYWGWPEGLDQLLLNPGHRHNFSQAGQGGVFHPEMAGRNIRRLKLKINGEQYVKKER